MDEVIDIEEEEDRGFVVRLLLHLKKWESLYRVGGTDEITYKGKVINLNDIRKEIDHVVPAHHRGIFYLKYVEGEPLGKGTVNKTFLRESRKNYIPQLKKALLDEDTTSYGTHLHKSLLSAINNEVNPTHISAALGWPVQSVMNAAKGYRKHEYVEKWRKYDRE